MNEEVTADLEELKAEWTPKQRTNWENHGKSVFERLEEASGIAEANGAELDVEAAKKWYLRLYRPKKRGEGMMERDHVKIGTPEHYMKKFLNKLNSPWGSIQGLMMAQFGIDEETQEVVEGAATAIVVAQHLGSKVEKAELAQKLEEHDKVAGLYGQ